MTANARVLGGVQVESVGHHRHALPITSAGQPGGVHRVLSDTLFTNWTANNYWTSDDGYGLYSDTFVGGKETRSVNTAFTPRLCV